MSRSMWVGVAAVISLAMGLLMISDESVWIDEVQTIRFAAQPSLSTFYDELIRSGKSEAQMPLGLLAAWMGAKILGLSEWQLRAANLPWIVLTGVGAMLVGRLYRREAFLWVVLTAPFLWYYANEARPYAIQICAGTWLLYFLLRFYTGTRIETSAVLGLGIVSVLGFGTHALFGFVVMGAGLAVAPAIFSRRASLTRQHILTAILVVLCLFITAAYYAWTVKRGAGGARIWSVGTVNLAFAGYELLGFGGLGLPRSDIRDLARAGGQQLLAAFTTPANLGVFFLSAVYALVLWGAIRMRQDRSLQATAAVVLISSFSLLAAASLMQFPFWGRHLAGLLPFVLFATWRCIDGAFAGTTRGILVGMLLVCFITSSLRQRCSPPYGKDDYRAAAAFASLALDKGLVVWWSADPEVAGYYRLPTTTNQASSRAVLVVVNHDPKRMNELPGPDLVVVSKPDIHDNGSAVKDYVARHGFIEAGRANGFVFWRRDPEHQR